MLLQPFSSALMFGDALDDSTQIFKKIKEHLPTVSISQDGLFFFVFI